MSRLLFENSKFALGFAGVTIIGAAIFAGASGSMDFAPAAEEQAAPAAPAQAPAQAAQTAQPGPMPAQPEIADFAPDEELIDNAEGFDPTPGETFELADNDAAEPGNAQPAGAPNAGGTASKPRSPSSSNSNAGFALPSGPPSSAPAVKRNYGSNSKPQGIKGKSKKKPRPGGRAVRANSAN